MRASRRRAVGRAPKVIPMREPSRRGIRGSSGTRGRGCLLALLALAGCSARATPARRPITRFVRDTGNINFVTTGGVAAQQSPRQHLRARTRPARRRCRASRPAPRSATPTCTGAAVGHAATDDTSVTLNGITVTASRTFTRTWTNVAPNCPFFGDFAERHQPGDVVTGNGTYTFGGLTVQTGAPHSGERSLSSVAGRSS